MWIRCYLNTVFACIFLTFSHYFGTVKLDIIAELNKTDLYILSICGNFERIVPVLKPNKYNNQVGVIK